MKFLQIHTFYDDYIADFFRRNSHLVDKEFNTQIEGLLQDGFSASHMIAPYMNLLGYDSTLVISNSLYSQHRWLSEHGITLPSTNNLIKEVLRVQIETIKPDILYLSDPINFDSRFLRTLSHKPGLVLGWRAASIPESTDWSSFDIVLSNSSVCREKALKQGAKATDYFTPGFPKNILPALQNVLKSHDIVFTGSITPEHSTRSTMLNEVSKGLLGIPREFSIAYYVACQKELLPAGIAMHNKGAVCGIEMYRAIKSGRVILNNQIDIAAGEAGNMRLLETTGVGSFILTDYHDNIKLYFEPQREIETYSSLGELMEKTVYYIDHPIERDAIAQRGQERCLRDYSMEVQARKLDSIVRKALNAKLNCQKSDLQVTDNTNEDLYDKAYLWGWNNPDLHQLVSLCYKTPDLADNARRFSMSEGFKEAVSLLIGMGKPPRKDVKVLDMGCGNGVATYALARLGYSVTGLDSSLGELAGLKAAAKLNGLDGAEFTLLHSKGESLDFSDESIDIVWMREVLHHIHDLKGFITEVARVLKPGGIICCLREHVIWNESQREHFFRTHPFYHITKDEGCYYLDEYTSAFEQSGLHLEKILSPIDSIINTYPAPFIPGLIFDKSAAQQRKEGNDLYSFFVRKMERRNELISNEFLGRSVETGNSVQLETLNIQVHCPQPSWTFLRTGNDCMLGAKFEFLSPTAQVKIGDRVYIGGGTSVICADQINMGNDILIAWGCTIIDHDTFPQDSELRRSLLRKKLDLYRRGDTAWNQPDMEFVAKAAITIEDNVWIGMNCTIMKGVTIGEGAVVGACSVVVSDVEPWTIVMGNPARRIM